MDPDDCVCVLCGASPFDLKYQEHDVIWPPELHMEDADTSWMADISLIGENPDSVIDGGVFVAHPVMHCGGNYFCLMPADEVVANDRNHVKLLELYGWNKSTRLIFPIHSSCFQILGEALYPRHIDNEMVYKTLLLLWDHGDQKKPKPLLDYGSPYEPMSYDWMLDKATAIFAHSPFPSLQFDTFYLSLAHSYNPQEYQTPPIGDSAGHGTDVFSCLAPELFLRIMDHLDVPSIGNWRIASRPAARIELTNGFWKSMCSNNMPWVYDIPPLDKGSKQDIDWKKMYRCLDDATHLDHPSVFRPLANRKRIWKTCQQFVEKYDQIDQQRPLLSNEILTTAVSTPLSRLVFPEDYDSDMKAINLVGSFSELEYQQPTISISWSDKNELAKIDVNDEASESSASFGHQDHIRIPENDWLTGFIVTTRRKASTERSLTDHTRDIIGISVLFVNQAPIQCGQSKGDQRLIHVSPGSFAVGLLVSSSMTTGKLQRLAFVQQPLEKVTLETQRRLTRSIPEPFNPSISRFLWKNQLPARDLGAFPYDITSVDDIATLDFCSVETLVFGRTEEQLSQIVSFAVDTRFRMFRVEYLDGGTQSIGPRFGICKSLKIDGPGGERITHFYRACSRLRLRLKMSLRFVTNFGRQLVLGLPAPLEQRCPPLVPGLSNHDDPLVGIYSAWNYHNPYSLALNVCAFAAPHVPELEASPLVQSHGLCWEPAPPPASAIRVGQIYGMTHYFRGGEPIGAQIIPASWLDCRRPLRSIKASVGENHWASSPACSLIFTYADNGEVAAVGPDLFFPESPLLTYEAMEGSDTEVSATTGSGSDGKSGHERYASETWAVNGLKLKCLRMWHDVEKVRAFQFVAENETESPVFGGKYACEHYTLAEIHFSGSGNNHADGIALFIINDKTASFSCSMSIAGIQAMQMIESS